MPTIQISNTLANRIAANSISISSVAVAQNYYQVPIVCNLTQIYLCANTIPVATPTVSNINSNKLITWIQVGSTDLSPTVTTGQTCVISTTANVATATGTATWFTMCVVVAGTTAVSSVTGTVGLIGSGADLEIADTSITAGTSYRVSNFTLTLPSTFTY